MMAPRSVSCVSVISARCARAAGVNPLWTMMLMTSNMDNGSTQGALKAGW